MPKTADHSSFVVGPALADSRRRSLAQLKGELEAWRTLRDEARGVLSLRQSVPEAEGVYAYPLPLEEVPGDMGVHVANYRLAHRRLEVASSASTHHSRAENERTYAAWHRDSGPVMGPARSYLPREEMVGSEVLSDVTGTLGFSRRDMTPVSVEALGSAGHRAIVCQGGSLSVAHKRTRRAGRKHRK